MIVQLSNKEYDYLDHFLNQKQIWPMFQILRFGVESIDIQIDEDKAGDLWQYLVEEVIYHLDSDYEPTETGKIIEALIDKFFF